MDETPASGHYESGNGTTFTWAMPQWGRADEYLCSMGLHLITRKRFLYGWIAYLTPIEHYYCACGRRRWIKFNDSFVECDIVDSGSALKWVEGHLRFQRLTTEMMEKSSG